MTDGTETLRVELGERSYDHRRRSRAAGGRGRARPPRGGWRQMLDRDRRKRGAAVPGDRGGVAARRRFARADHRSAAGGRKQKPPYRRNRGRFRAGRRARTVVHAGGAGWRRGGGHHRLRGQPDIARRQLRPDSDHPAGAGRQLGRRKDGREHPARQESGGRVLSAQAGPGRHGNARHPAAARIAGGLRGSREIRPDPGRRLLRLAGGQRRQAAGGRRRRTHPRRQGKLRGQGGDRRRGRVRERRPRAAEFRPHLRPRPGGGDRVRSGTSCTAKPSPSA